MTKYYIEQVDTEYFIYTEDRLVEYACDTYKNLSPNYPQDTELMEKYTLEDLEDPEVSLSFLSEYFESIGTVFGRGFMVH